MCTLTPKQVKDELLRICGDKAKLKFVVLVRSNVLEFINRKKNTKRKAKTRKTTLIILIYIYIYTKYAFCVVVSLNYFKF